MDITKLDAVSILSDDVLTEVFEEQDPILQAKLLLSLQEKAKGEMQNISPLLIYLENYL